MVLKRHHQQKWTDYINIWHFRWQCLFRFRSVCTRQIGFSARSVATLHCLSLGEHFHPVFIWLNCYQDVNCYQSSPSLSCATIRVVTTTISWDNLTRTLGWNKTFDTIFRLFCRYHLSKMVKFGFSLDTMKSFIFRYLTLLLIQASKCGFEDLSSISGSVKGIIWTCIFGHVRWDSLDIKYWITFTQTMWSNLNRIKLGEHV